MRFSRDLPLLTRLLLGVISIVIVIAMLIASLNVAQERALAELRAQSLMHQVQVLTLPTIVEGVVTGDYARIKQNLTTQAQLRPEVSRLVWRNPQGPYLVGDSPITSSIAPQWFLRLLGLPAETLAAPLSYGGQAYGELLMDFDPAKKNNALWRDLVRYVQLVALAIMLIAVFVYWALKRSLHTIADLVKAVAQMQSGNYSYAVPESGAPELRLLVRAFNEGNLRLGGLIKSLRQREMEQVEQLEEIHAKNYALQEFQRAVDAAVILVKTDLAGNITFVNDKFVVISGYSRTELLGKNYRLVNSAVHTHEFFTELWTTIVSGKVWHGEICNQAKDGRLFWVDTTIVPIMDESNERPLRYKAIQFEITARKALEYSLSLEKERAEVTLASIGDAVLTTDALGNVVFLNQVAQQLTGWTQLDAVGLPIEQVFHMAMSQLIVELHPYPVLQTKQREETRHHESDQSSFASQDNWPGYE